MEILHSRKNHYSIQVSVTALVQSVVEWCQWYNGEEHGALRLEGNVPFYSSSKYRTYCFQ